MEFKKVVRYVGPAILVLSLGILAMYVVAGPVNKPRASDVTNAQRTAVPASGADERAPFAGAGVIGGSGVVEPSDRESKVGGQAPGRIASILVNEGDVVVHPVPSEGKR